MEGNFKIVPVYASVEAREKLRWKGGFTSVQRVELRRNIDDDIPMATIWVDEAGEILRQQVDIMRRLWTGESVSHEGDFYAFHDVDIHPSPAAPGSIPIWYCGNSPLSVRKAVEYCDGWMPGRITLKTFRKRVERLDELSQEAGRPRPSVAAIPIVSPGPTREAALAHVNWREMMQQAINSRWETPDSGEWASPEDLEGALIAGTTDDIVEATVRYHEAGLEHLVYDLRFRFADWRSCLATLGEEVLPRLRAMGDIPRVAGA